MFLSANSFFLKFLIMLSIMKIFRALLLNNKPYGLAFYSSKLYSEKTGAFKSKVSYYPMYKFKLNFNM